MKKSLFIIVLFLGSLSNFLACAPQAAQDPRTENSAQPQNAPTKIAKQETAISKKQFEEARTQTPNANVHSPNPIRPRPGVSRLSFGTDPIAKIGEITAVGQLVILTENFTTVVYTLSGETLAVSQSDLSPKFQNNKGLTGEPLVLDLLADFGQLKVMAATFKALPSETSELCLALHSTETESPVLLQVAKIETKTNLSIGGAVFREGYLEQSGYQVSYNGFSLYIGDRVGNALTDKGMTDEEMDNARATRAAISSPDTKVATREPSKPNPLTIELADGSTIINHGTLRVANSATGQVHFIYFVVLPDGTSRAKVLKE